MNFKFDPSEKSSQAFRSVMGESMAKNLLSQSEKESGWHSSPSDSLEHLTVKNAAGKVTGHIYKDGSRKDKNGSLSWL